MLVIDHSLRLIIVDAWGPASAVDPRSTLYSLPTQEPFLFWEVKLRAKKLEFWSEISARGSLRRR